MSDQSRKLAAIVFTDIVSFTKLTAEDQQKASDLLDTQRKELKPIVDGYQGNWVKEMGDGLILTFDTVNKAVHCCVKMQQKARSIQNLDLRIGIHLGEILEKDNDIIGDDVNITARIEPFSAPGGIAISNKVNDTIIREPDFKTKYLGKPKLKGVGQEVKVYCIVSHDLPETKLSDVSAKLETESKNIFIGIAAFLLLIPIIIYFSFFAKDRIDSIAVLYMDIGNFSELKYLETMTEDLIFDLTSSSQGLIKVSESVVVKKYKETELSLEDLADEIGVDYVFKSSVQPDGSGFMFRVRLYDSDERKDRFINKWFIEKNSLQSVVGVLVDNIIKDLDIEKSESYRRLEYDPDAYSMYLQAKSNYTISKNYEDNKAAISMMEEAVSKDGNLIAAQIYLGAMLYDLGNYNQASIIYENALGKSKTLQDNANIAESLRKQGQLLRKKKDLEGALSKMTEALAMSTVMNDKSSMAKTLNSMAIVNWKMKDKDSALKNWLQALNIVEEFDDKPKISKYLNNIGIWYRDDFDYSKSVEYYEKSLSIKESLGDTRNISKTLNNMGNVFFLMGDYTSSVEQYKKSIDIKEQLQDIEGLAKTLNNIGETYFHLGDYNSANTSFIKSIGLTKNNDLIHENQKYLGIAHYELSNYDSSKIYLKKADEYFKGDVKKRLSILPLLVISNKKTQNEDVADDLVREMKKINEEHEPAPKDYIISNYYAFQTMKIFNMESDAALFLENAYLEMKSKSKDIKNKSDRNTYLNTLLHKKIAEAWANK